MRKILLTSIIACAFSSISAQQPKSSFNQRWASLTSITDEGKVAGELKKLTDSQVEEDQLLAYYFYSEKGPESKAVSLKSAILKIFPNGQLALQEKMDAISALRSLEEKDKAFLELTKEFPNQNFSYLANDVAQEFAQAGNEQKMKFYADIVASSATDGQGIKFKPSTIYGRLAVFMTKSNPEAAARYLKDALQDSKAAYEAMLVDKSTDKRVFERSKRSYYNLLNSYILAMTAGSNPELAFEVSVQSLADLRKAVPQDTLLITYMESAYAKTLVATGRYKEALPYIEKFILSGSNDKNLEENLQKSFVAAYGSSQGFETYKAKLLSERDSRYLDEIAAKSVNLAAPQFSLKDVNGNSVGLSDLKGKVIVLDFWATWCGPCKASFPMMQKALDKYKADPNVRFFFIHTWEKGSADPVAAAKNFVEDNNYSFDVLMDLRNPDTKLSAVAASYKVNGIPTKIIIDREGRIRFNTSGFSAQEDAAIRELTAMIEFARKSGN